MSAPRTSAEVQLTARALMIVIAPLLLLGVVLTISLFGAYFGVLLLLLTIPVAWTAWKVNSEPNSPALLNRLNVAAYAVAVTLTVAFVIGVITGRDDLDTAVEFLLLALSLVWIGTSWWISARTRAHRSEP